MVTFNQIQNGLIAYVEREMIPKLDGIKQFGLGVYAALASKNIASTINKYKTNPAIAMLDAIDENDEVDIDRIYDAACQMFNNRDHYSIVIPLIGEWKIDRTDVEKLYKYIKN